QRWRGGGSPWMSGWPGRRRRTRRAGGKVRFSGSPYAPPLQNQWEDASGLGAAVNGKQLRHEAARTCQSVRVLLAPSAPALQSKRKVGSRTEYAHLSIADRNGATLSFSLNSRGRQGQLLDHGPTPDLAQFGPKPALPTRMRSEYWSEFPAACAASLMCACCFSASNGRLPARLPCSYANSSALPLSSRRQFHGAAAAPATALVWMRMLVVQLLVMAL